MSSLPPILLGVAFGSRAVGVYDALSRLPRLLKSFLFAAQSPAVPALARLAAMEGSTYLSFVLHSGPRLAGVATAAVCLPIAGLSQPLLFLWLGEEIAAYWPWHAILVMLVFVSSLGSIPSYAALTNRRGLQRLNHAVFLGTLFYFLTALGLQPWLPITSFWLGQVVLVFITVPLILANTDRLFPPPPGSRLLAIVRSFACSSVSLAFLAAIQHAGVVFTWPLLAVCLIMSVALNTLLSYYGVLNRDERTWLKRTVLRQLRRSGQGPG